MEQLDPIKLRIRQAANRGALSHALLITGNGDRIAAARYAAAAMQCRGQEKPCGSCPACHKVAADIHPDVITVKDDAHKNLSVDVIREIRADAYIRPNEGERKVYIIPDCGILTERDQNILLKTVEEGPPYAAFIFCAENAAVVLQTLRSRCVELKLYAAEAEAGEASEWGDELCRRMGKRGAVTELAVRLEKKRLDREEIAAMLARSGDLLTEALLTIYRQEAPQKDREIVEKLLKNLTKNQIMRTIELLKKYRAECAYNVGASHVLGALAVELEDTP